MTSDFRVSLLEKDGGSWAAAIDELRVRLGAPNNPALFPPHFLKASFPKIGGQVVVVEQGRAISGAGLLFPRALAADARVLTLRFHRALPEIEIDRQRLVAEVERLVSPDRVVYYDPLERQRYARTSWQIDGIEVGRPDEAEAHEIRTLQQQIWASEPDFLYPADIHSTGFGIGSSLVARVDDKPVGFLFAFFKLGGSIIPAAWDAKFRGDFRLESQLLAVLPANSGGGIGSVLKRAQAELARREGVHVVNWTVDPLQFRNAVLNFARLKAVAFDFYPKHYDFENALNQVAASRLAITWLVDSERVRQGVSNPAEVAVAHLADVHASPVNDGWRALYFESAEAAIAIEVPPDWTQLQRRDVHQARKWREATDTLFERYLGCEEGQYIITGVAQDGDRRFLVAERVDPPLLARLGR